MSWRIVFYSVIVICMLLSCGTNHTTIKEYIKNSDSVSIAFYDLNKQTTQIVVKDKATITKLGNFMDGKGIEAPKCADNGSIWFYEGGKKKMEVDFILNNECQSFSYMMNDKLYSKSMSDDANKYLLSVKNIASDSL